MTTGQPEALVAPKADALAWTSILRSESLKAYRYRQFNEYWRQGVTAALESRSVWMGPVDKFNDPFDGNPVIERTRIQDDIEFEKSAIYRMAGYIVQSKTFADRYSERGISNSEFNEALALEFKRSFRSDYCEEIFDSALSHTEVVNVFRSRFTAACFCRCEDLPTMWAYYSADHTGFLIEYDDHYNYPPFPFSISMPRDIEYSEVRPIVSLWDVWEALAFLIYSQNWVGTPLSIARSSPVAKACRAILLTKSSHWAIEEDFRIVSVGEPGYREWTGLVPVRVVLGCRVSEKDRDEMLKIVGGRVPVFQARPHDSLYQLEIAPL